MLSVPSSPLLLVLLLWEQVFASIEVPPVRQTLYLRGVQLSGASTLHAANIKAGDTLHLKVREGRTSRSNTSRYIKPDQIDGLALKSTAACTAPSGLNFPLF